MLCLFHKIVTPPVAIMQLFTHIFQQDLTHWGRVTHICVSKLIIIASDNGLSPGRRQAIIWTSAGILLIGPLGTNFSEILIAIITFSFKKMRLKVLSAKWRPCCLGLNVLIWDQILDATVDPNLYNSVYYNHANSISGCCTLLCYIQYILEERYVASRECVCQLCCIITALKLNKLISVMSVD